jgi:hypothetical protein
MTQWQSGSSLWVWTLVIIDEILYDAWGIYMPMEMLAYFGSFIV